MAREPLRGEPGDLLQLPRLLEEVRRPRHDLQLLLRAHPRISLPVHLPYGVVFSPDDQERRGRDAGQRLTRQVRAPAARDDSSDFWTLGGRDQRGPGSGAGAEVADPEILRVRFLGEPVGGADETFG